MQHFRSYTDEAFEFDPGVNIIVGPNGSGKTNLLEAILVIASGGSYRARDIDLLQFDEPWARLDGLFDKQNRILKMVVQDSKVQKTYELGGKAYKRLSLERTVPAVLFEPNHLQLVIRGPEQRREYFDDILQRTKAGFKSLRVGYRRTLAQRNSLLKQKRDRADKQLFAWNVRLSELGSQIVAARLSLIDDINEQISNTYSDISGKKSVLKLGYETPINTQHYSSRLLSKLETSAEKDFERGFTLYGPHREDIIIYLDGQPANISASRGEIRSLILSLKIYELLLLEKARNIKPLFLLDDVFSELDGKRRQQLVKYLKNYQTIITTTDAEAVLEYFSKNTKLIPLTRTT